MLIHNKKLAVVMNLFPDIFFEYLIFTLPLWTLIYLWGVPRFLMADAKKTDLQRIIKIIYKSDVYCYDTV